MDVLCAYVGLHNQEMPARPRTEGFACHFCTQGAQEVGPRQRLSVPTPLLFSNWRISHLAKTASEGTRAQLHVPDCASLIQFSRVCCKVRHLGKYLMGGYYKPSPVGGSEGPGLLIWLRGLQAACLRTFWLVLDGTFETVI